MLDFVLAQKYTKKWHTIIFAIGELVSSISSYTDGRINDDRY